MTRLSELMKPAEAPTRPSERVQEPEVSVPSEEPVTPPEVPSEVPRPQQAPVEKQDTNIDEQKDRISTLRENIKALRQQRDVVEESSKPAYAKRIEQYEAEIKAIQAELPKTPRKVNTIESLTKEIGQLEARKERETLAINKRAYAREIEKRGKLLAKLKEKQSASAEEGKISLENAEVISDKSSTGKVYRIGDKVYKSGLFVGFPEDA